MKAKIDLNLDAGESLESLQTGLEESLYQLVNSVNIACGGHTGNDTTMTASVQLAQKYKLNIGAHPSFEDQKNFGREILKISSSQLTVSIVKQIQNLKSITEKFGAQLKHVKPHGALYNLAANDFDTAQAVIAAVKQVDPKLVIVGLAGSAFIKVIKKSGLKAYEEAFCDRVYESDGTLRKRILADSMIKDPQLAARQALQIINTQSVVSHDGKTVSLDADTLCIHGDTENALAVAVAVKNLIR